MQGVQFSFTPTVNNPGGVALTFTATNLPGWASINSSTGQITGTPALADIGVYSNISVTVSGGGQSVTSPGYSITVVAAATGSATLTWQAPTTRTDGSLLGASLAGYRIYYGQSPTNLSQSVNVSTGLLTYVIDNLTPATWYFAATAYDSGGLESAYSNIASKTIL